MQKIGVCKRVVCMWKARKEFLWCFSRICLNNKLEIKVVFVRLLFPLTFFLCRYRYVEEDMCVRLNIFDQLLYVEISRPKILWMSLLSESMTSLLLLNSTFFWYVGILCSKWPDSRIVKDYYIRKWKASVRRTFLKIQISAVGKL
jgi:hypothetical protein